MRRLLLLTSLLVPAAIAPAADAATVQYQDEPRKLRYDAAPGEANRLSVTQAGQIVTLTDPGASGMQIAKDDTDCTVVSPTEARCVVPIEAFEIDAQLADGNDETTAVATSPVVGLKAHGGDGDDVLTGGAGPDKLDGGAGKDTFAAGDGDDVVAAHDGVLETVACGAGNDTGEADLEDEVAADCETVDKPLGPPTLGEAQRQPAKPERGKSVAVAVKQGIVLVRRPGTDAAVPLDPTQPVPVGSVLDATRGTLTLTVATPRGVARTAQAGSGTQTADFTGSRFVVSQTPGTAQTQLKMTGGDFSQCGTTARSASRGTAFAAASRRKRRVRSLWGSGHGRFTTRGRNSSATVRGTIWRVTDRCDGTLTTVTRGVVVVHDHVRNRTKVLRKGQSYLARRGATAKRRR